MRNGMQLEADLSLFVNDKLGILAVFLIGGYHDKIHVGGNPKASAAAEFAFQLVSQVGCFVI